MEATLMTSVVTLDASPAGVLRALRGLIVDARLAYPNVLHVEIRDAASGLWRLATQDAEWSPPDPTKLVGTSVQGAAIHEGTGELRLELSDGLLRVIPGSRGPSDDPPNWELITPDGVLLEFGPGLRWQISGADAGGEGKDIDLLTERELQVLELLGKGRLSNRDIAERLQLSPGTVSHHVGRVLAKLGLQGRAEAAAYAARELGQGRDSATK